MKKWIIVLVIPLFLAACADDDHFDPHLKNSQNPEAYVDSKTAKIPLISSMKQEKLYRAFLTHYYSPWYDKISTFTDVSFKNYVRRTLHNYSYRLGYDENEHHHNKKWMKNILDNINIDTFPNHLKNAIITRSTFERSLPTNKPSFSSLTKPGLAYPFDNFQNSFLPANLPVKILQETQNHAWDFVLSNGSSGWVKASTLATTDKKFIEGWQKNKGYIEFKNDHVAIIDEKNIFRFTSHMGAIYPIQSETSTQYIIKIAIKDPNGKAMLTSARIAKMNADKIPLPPTPQNVAKIAKRFLGMPYGWGGIYGYRDCSATTKDLYSYFGIWLPRDSMQQASILGKPFNVKDLSNKEKLKKLDADAIPFFTLIHLDGHIMVYIGKKNGEYYVFHDMWGLKTRRLFQSEGRAVVGKTVITPLDFGKGYLNVKSSLLDRMLDFTTIPA
jgi:hypothetical protein